ncbi:hypothetical protein [Granulicella arctica]|uniref:Outer membrane protein beta-barrel domain-containing protein n=1 Tax=Granulicella arctica TaxID=940613 RepID=A0A7Y9PGD9_9BACT|nr:hypothetical protein [Granulicella arctica]NYF79396.1 hypothetical protein [Granulicella arctica]
MNRIRLVVALTVLLLPGVLKAQVGVYAAFSETKLNIANTDWIKGATFGAYYDAVHLPLVNFGVDARGSVLGGSGMTQVKSGLFGPRAVAHLPIVPLKPYVEGLIGAGQVQVGQGTAASSATHLEYGLAAGADFTFFPRLDWRVVDYQYGGFDRLNGTTGQKTISTGLVFRLPIP